MPQCGAMRVRSSRAPVLLGLLLATVAWALGPATGAAGSITLIGDSEWRYSDEDRQLLGTWLGPGYDDTAWPEVDRLLALGEQGSVDPPDPVAQTVYLRGSFFLDDPGQIRDVRLAWQRDDGAVVYLNGTEVARSNMPDGPVGHGTRASGIDNWDGQEPLETELPVGLLRAGENVVAVSVHQAGDGNWVSSDLVFRGVLTASTATYSGPPPAPIPQGWRLVDGDDFAGSTIDPSRWRTYDPSWGTGQYGNADPHSLHCLTQDNVTVAGGTAVIEAKRQPTQCGGAVRNYSSGFLTSREAGRYYPLYGRFEIQARVPHGQGIWPAFWLRHVDGASTAEIDVMEVFHSSDPGTVSHSLHFPDSSGAHASSAAVPFEAAVPGTGGWHTFAVDIDPVYPGRDDAVRFTFWVDGTKTHEFVDTDAAAWTDVPDQSRLWDVAINVAVGGTWVGHPDQRLGWLPASGGRCALERPQRFDQSGNCAVERTAGGQYNATLQAAPLPDGQPDIWLVPWSSEDAGDGIEFVVDYFRYYARR